MYNKTLEVPISHCIDNDIQNDPCHMPNALPQISEFNPHQFTSSSSECYSNKFLKFN